VLEVGARAGDGLRIRLDLDAAAGSRLAVDGSRKTVRCPFVYVKPAVPGSGRKGGVTVGGSGYAYVLVV